MSDTKPTIGLIGLGDMGSPMGRNLIANGYPLVVHDINPPAMQPFLDLGAKGASSAAEVANLVRTVMVSLPNLDATREVALGKNGIAAGSSAKTYIDLSTTGSKVAKEIAAGLAARGITALDAPVTGGMAGAQKGTLTVMVSGPKSAFDEVRLVFDAIGSKVFFVGEQAGQAQIVKVINNLLSATAIAVTAEAFVLGAKAGIDADVLLEVINNGTGRNTATEDKFPRSVLPRKFDFFARTEIIYKDVYLCLQEAEDREVPMWIGNAVKQLWGYAMSQGAAKEDMTTLVKYLERWTGVEVRGKGYETTFVPQAGA